MKEKRRIMNAPISPKNPEPAPKKEEEPKEESEPSNPGEIPKIFFYDKNLSSLVNEFRKKVSEGKDVDLEFFMRNKMRYVICIRVKGPEIKTEADGSVWVRMK